MLRVALAFCLTSCLPLAASAADGRLIAAGGEFRLQLGDGRVLTDDALVGSRIVLTMGGQERVILIDAVERDRADDGRAVLLYRLLAEDPATGSRHDLCQPDARGRRLGFPIPSRSGFDVTCTSGAQGKCILMGYRPWDEREDAPMRALHQACIHAVRADYGGDDHPATQDGTLIDLYDRYGIRKSEEDEPMPFEAAWGVQGALCVAHPRIAGKVTLDELARRYPALAGSLGATDCREEAMRHHPQALLFNRSAPPIWP